MADVSMQVIDEPEPNTRTVLISQTFPPQGFFKGDGHVNYVCGSCGFVLAESLANASQISNVVMKCPRCAAYNETRT